MITQASPRLSEDTTLPVVHEVRIRPGGDT
jgi:hypothetical protein